MSHGYLIQKISISLFLVIFSLFFCSTSNAIQTKDYPFLCLVPNSHVKMFASSLRSDTLQKAHDLAFEEDGFKNIKVITSTSDSDLISQLESNIKMGCKIFLGLYTSKECLLAGPIIKKYNGLIISPTCGHNDIEKWSGYIYSLVPSIEKYTEEIAVFTKTFQNNSILVVWQPTDMFSSFSYKEFTKTSGSNFKTIQLDKQGNIYKDDLENVMQKSYSLIVFLTYPVPALKFLNSAIQTLKDTKKTIIMGGSSWPFDNSVFKSSSDVLNKFEKVMVPNIAPISKIKNSKFFKKFVQIHKENPLGIHAISYDATRLVTHCLLQIKKYYSKESFIKCIENSKFTGLYGSYKFKPNYPFTDRNIYFEELKESF